MSGSPIIIESDALDAWLGLLGVITGAAITTVTTWFQNRHRDRAEQRRELEVAKGQLIASATSIVILVGWYHGARSISPGSDLRNVLGTESEWVEKIANALERLQLADRVIQLHGQTEVAQASGTVVSQAADLARGGRNGADDVDEAIAAFKEVWRQ